MIAQTNFLTSLHFFLKRHRLGLLLGLALLWATLGLSLNNLKTDTTILSFFPDKSQEMTRLVKAMDLAPLTRLLFLDLASEDGASVDELKSLAHELILAIQPELASPLQVFKEPEPKAFLELLPNFFDAAAEKYARSQSDPKTIAKNLETAKLNLAGLLGQGLSPWLAFDPLNFKKIIFERLPKSTLLKIAPIEDFPLSADQKHLLILLRPTHSLYDASSAQKLMRAIEQAWQELKPKNVQLTIVGGIRHTAVNTTTIHNDIKTILFCSLLGFGLTYLFLVRSVGMVWLLLTPCLAASLGMAAVHLCYPVVSGLALGFGASVLGLAEDYAVHMHFALRSQKAALSLEELGRPLFQGFLLNLTGLVVLCCSGLPAVRQLALFALTTLGAGYLLAVTVLPVCPFFESPPYPKAKAKQSKFQPKLGPIVLLTFGLLGLGLWALGQSKVDVSPQSLGADVAKIKKDTAKLKQIWGDSKASLYVIEGEDFACCLYKLQRTVQFLKATSPDLELQSLAPLFPAKEEQTENQERFKAFVQQYGEQLKKELAKNAQILGFTSKAFAPFLEIIYQDPKPLELKAYEEAGLSALCANFLNLGKGAVRTLLLTAEPITLEKLPKDLGQELIPLDPTKLEKNLLQLFSQETKWVPLGFLLCLSLLFIFLRKPSQVLLAALPPLAALSCILTCHVLLNWPLNLASLAAMPLVLGLATDHGLLVTYDLTSSNFFGLNRAILVSSLTALTSMGLLATATHPALASMGRVILIGLSVELLASLFLIPLLASSKLPPKNL